jgi:hypothetical protein
LRDPDFRNKSFLNVYSRLSDPVARLLPPSLAKRALMAIVAIDGACGVVVSRDDLRFRTVHLAPQLSAARVSRAMERISQDYGLVLFPPLQTAQKYPPVPYRPIRRSD